MSSNRHLVVAYNFPPFVDASAITQAKRIAVAGHRVDVVSQDLTGLRPRDDALRALISHLIDVHDIIPGRPAFMSWPSMRHFAAGGLRRLAVRGTLARYATVYSRSMWPHSHVLAALVKAVHPGVHWSAEFSDPLLHNVDGSRRRSPRLPEDDAILLRLTRSLPVGYQELVRNGGQVLDLIQALTFGLADRLVFTNPQQRTVMLGDVGDDALAHDAQNRSLVSAHPVPPAHWVPPHSPHIGKRFGQVRIGFFGTL